MNWNKPITSLHENCRKKRIKKGSVKRFLIIGICCLSLQAGAQKKWTLQECIDYALKNSITVQQSDLTTRDARVTQMQGKTNYLPTVNGFATNNFNFGRSIDPFTNTFVNQRIRSNSFGVSSALTLFNGLQNYSTLKQNELLFKASQYDMEQVKNDLSLSVANAFLTVLLNEEILAGTRLQIDNTRKQLERTDKLYQAGSVNIGNVLDLKAQLANEQLNVVTAQNQVKMAFLALWQLMELPYDPNNQIEHPLLNVPSAAESVFVSALYEGYATRAPEFQSANMRLLAAGRSLDLAHGGRSPRLTLNGNISTTYSESFRSATTRQVIPFSQQLKDNQGKSLGFTLSIPVLNGWAVNNNIQRAKVNIERSKLNQKQTNNQAYRTITQAVLDLEAAKARFEAASNSYEASNLSYKNAEQRFNVGALNFTDYSVLKNNFMRAETVMIQAKYEYIFRQKVVDFYSGKPIILQ